MDFPEAKNDRPSASWSDVRIALRVGRRTGLLGALRPAGVLALSRALRAPPSPAVLYKLHAANSPDKIALCHGSRRLTYREMGLRVARLAGGLRAIGLDRGDAALVMLPNRPEFLEVQGAMTLLGGSAVSVSWRSTAAELGYVAKDSGAKALIFAESSSDCVLAADLGAISERGRIVVLDGTSEGSPGGARTRGARRYEELLLDSDPLDDSASATGGAVIIYTSGTTGRPKGAVRKFPRSLAQAVLRFIDQTPMRHDDRHLAVCPLYHASAFGFIGMNFVVGSTVVLCEHFEPEEFLRLVDREAITTTTVVPTMLHRVLALPAEVRRRYRTSSLRAIFCGAAPLPPALASRVLAEFGPVLYNFYGATETGLVTLATPEHLSRHPDTIGKALPLNDIRLLDEEGADVGAGQVGELFVKNPMIVAGYHGDPDSTRAALRGEHFSVGDLARRDAEGLYYVEGRKRDLIISGGVNVYPAEVENALLGHPAVAEAAVVGVSDEEWGERVRAFVALHDGQRTSPEDIIAFCRTQLGGAKVPREIVILPELPRNPTGKVLKRELRDWKPAG